MAPRSHRLAGLRGVLELSKSYKNETGFMGFGLYFDYFFETPNQGWLWKTAYKDDTAKQLYFLAERVVALYGQVPGRFTFQTNLSSLPQN